MSGMATHIYRDVHTYIFHTNHTEQLEIHWNIQNITKNMHTAHTVLIFVVFWWYYYNKISHYKTYILMEHNVYAPKQK